MALLSGGRVTGLLFGKSRLSLKNGKREEKEMGSLPGSDQGFPIKPYTPWKGKEGCDFIVTERESDGMR